MRYRWVIDWVAIAVVAYILSSPFFDVIYREWGHWDILGSRLVLCGVFAFVFWGIPLVLHLWAGGGQRHMGDW